MSRRTQRSCGPLIVSSQHVAPFQTRRSRIGIPRSHALLEFPDRLQSILSPNVVCQVSLARESRRSNFATFADLHHHLQISYGAIVILHTLELVALPPAHLPDLFVVFNLTLSAIVFSLGFLWGTKRSLQEGWAVVGIQSLGPDIGSAKGSSHHGRKVGSERNGNLRPVERRAANSSAGDPGYPSTRVRQDLPRQRLAPTSGRSTGRL